MMIIIITIKNRATNQQYQKEFDNLFLQQKQENLELQRHMSNLFAVVLVAYKSPLLVAFNFLIQRFLSLSFSIFLLVFFCCFFLCVFIFVFFFFYFFVSYFFKFCFSQEEAECEVDLNLDFWKRKKEKVEQSTIKASFSQVNVSRIAPAFSFSPPPLIGSFSMNLTFSSNKKQLVQKIKRGTTEAKAQTKTEVVTQLICSAVDMSVGYSVLIDSVEWGGVRFVKLLPSFSRSQMQSVHFAHFQDNI